MFKSLPFQILASIILGGVAVFSYSPFDIWPIAFISFGGLLALIANKTTKQAILLSFSWGIGYFTIGVHWVYISIRQYGELPVPVALFILLLFILYLSLYPLLFGYLLKTLKKFAPAFTFTQLVLLAPLLWQFTEYLRANILSGFAWLEFGYTQLHSPLRALFPIIGINGLNLVFCLLSGLLVFVARNIYLSLKLTQKTDLRHLYSAIIALFLILLAPLTLSGIKWTQAHTDRQANVTLIQANIPQSIRWNSKQLKDTLETYFRLTEENLKPNNIIIWSEAAITDIETNQQNYLRILDHLARTERSSIAVGILDFARNSKNYNIYNSLIVLGDESPYQYPTTNRYEKHHLVPFGEYVPLESILKPIANLLDIPMSSMSSGKKSQKPLLIQGFKFLTVICYEAILSDLVLANFTQDTDFLLTVSNDAWFGDSIGPWQHLQMAQTRALEFERTLIRATNNGITVIVDEKGNITQQLPQFKETTLDAVVIARSGLTPYANWGNLPYYLACFAIFSIIIMRYHRTKK